MSVTIRTQEAIAEEMEIAIGTVNTTVDSFKKRQMAGTESGFTPYLYNIEYR